MSHDSGINYAKLQAVHRLDLAEFLNSLGVLQSVLDRKHSCMRCKTDLSISDIARVVLIGGTVAFICKNPKCMLQSEGDIEDAAC